MPASAAAAIVSSADSSGMRMQPRPMRSSPGFSQSGIAEQVLLEPARGRAHRRELVRALRETVTLVLEHDVLHRSSERAELLDELIGLSAHDARVLRSLNDEQGRLRVLDVRQRRALAQELGV